MTEQINEQVDILKRLKLIILLKRTKRNFTNSLSTEKSVQVKQRLQLEIITHLLLILMKMEQQLSMKDQTSLFKTTNIL